MLVKEPINKKDHILEMAEELFSQHGFEGTTTRMIAGNAGVNISMLSYYFGGKEQLFRELVEKKLGYMQLVLSNLREKKVTSWEKMKNLIDIYVDRIFDNRRFSRIMHHEITLNQRSELSTFISQGYYRNMVLVRELIEEGQKNKEFHADLDIPMLMASLFGTMSNVVYAPVLCALLLDDGTLPEKVMNEKTKERLKKHLKRLMKSYLVK